MTDYYQKLTDGPTPKPNRKHAPVILYRKSGVDNKKVWEDELRAMNNHFVTLDSRSRVHGGDLVIGRYSVLPFYKELETDLHYNGCSLINSYREHLYIADLQNWVQTLGTLTPTTWGDLQDVPDGGGPFVLKGETNSKKDKWKTHMFARNKKEAIQVFMRLNDDALISQQKIYIRQFEPMRVLTVNSFTEQPITEEYRFFVCYKQILSHGFYWSNFADDIGELPKPSQVVLDFAQKVAGILGEHTNFMAIDIGVRPNGEPFVVEVNDGQMSGLSENDPETLYKNLKRVTWDDLPGF